jgi:hypothetical protein
MKYWKQLTIAAALISSMPAALAVEGMWLPEQMPQLAQDLKDKGLLLTPDNLSDLTSYPMNAIVSLGGCTASFVSPDGLIVTNHHCIYGDLQYNSSVDNNLIEKGFLARTRAEEKPAAPGRKVWVTVAVEDVTREARLGTENLTGKALLDRLEANNKNLIQKCEDEYHHCRVFEFYGGAKYYRLKQLEIKDLRVVYAPTDAIGKFGGDIDNWMWPRHTGDFGFYRAYVGKDGKPAPYSKDNVPFHPPAYLKISKKGIHDGSFVMVAGYPGRTNRHRISMEVRHQFQWYYPVMQKILSDWSGIIAEVSRENPEAGVKYASRVAGLNNYAKNFQGMIEGFGRSQMLSHKIAFEKTLVQWIQSKPERQSLYGQALERLESALAESQQFEKTRLYQGLLTRSGLLPVARDIYKWSINQQKADNERELGYQERDRERMMGRLSSIDRRFDLAVEARLYRYFLERYLALPRSERFSELDALFGLNDDSFSVEKSVEWFTRLHKQSRLLDTEERLKALSSSPDELRERKDPLLDFAIRLHGVLEKIDDRAKSFRGKVKAARRQYMAAKLAYFAEKNAPVYDDANSSLRITYGTVQGYEPVTPLKKQVDGSLCTDAGCRYTAFTTAQGILHKDRGQRPFLVPAKERELLEKRLFGEYEDDTLKTLPVNFLSDVDTTGGNSGSPTLDADGHLVGLLFDGTYETLNSDWEYTPNTRSIHVDIRYMLWVMQYIDNADNLIREMKFD